MLDSCGKYSQPQPLFVLIPVDYHTDVVLICDLMLIFKSLIIF